MDLIVTTKVKDRKFKAGVPTRVTEEEYLDWYFSGGSNIPHDVEKAEEANSNVNAG